MLNEKHSVIYKKTLVDNKHLKNTLLHYINILSDFRITSSYTTEFTDFVDHLNIYHIKLFSITNIKDYCYIYRTHKYEPKEIIKRALSFRLEPKDISFIFKVEDTMYSISFDKYNRYLIIKFYSTGSVYNVYKLSVRDNMDIIQALFNIPILIRYENPDKNTLQDIIKSTYTNIEIPSFDMFYTYGEIIDNKYFK